MKNIEYKIKCIRLNEETWSKFKSKRKKSGLTWNMFVMEILKKL